MAEVIKDKDVEDLIRNSVFTNPSHKEALRERLFEPKVFELCLDDLAAAAGGVKLPEEEKHD